MAARLTRPMPCLRRKINNHKHNLPCSPPCHQGATREQDLSSLESTVAALKEDYERTLNVNAASQKDLQQNLVSAKHDLLRVQEQLAMAEKV